MNDGPLDFRGKSFVVSGGASGIGLATVKLASRLGARVIVWDQAGADAVAEEVVNNGGAAVAVNCDVTDRRAVEANADRLGPIHAVITCAGICPTDDWTNDDFDEIFDKTIAVNVKGSINLARAFMPGMIERRHGRIVFIGSVSGRTSSGSGIHYGASKGGVHSAVRWLARQGAPHNVLANAIAPGPIATPMIAGREQKLIARTPLGRIADPNEIAWPIMFLCSPMADFITGSIMDVNGGVFIG